MPKRSIQVTSVRRETPRDFAARVWFPAQRSRADSIDSRVRLVVLRAGGSTRAPGGGGGAVGGGGGTLGGGELGGGELGARLGDEVSR